MSKNLPSCSNQLYLIIANNKTVPLSSVFKLFKNPSPIIRSIVQRFRKARTHGLRFIGTSGHDKLPFLCSADHAFHKKTVSTIDCLVSPAGNGPTYGSCPCSAIPKQQTRPDSDVSHPVTGGSVKTFLSKTLPFSHDSKSEVNERFVRTVVPDIADLHVKSGICIAAASQRSTT